MDTLERQLIDARAEYNRAFRQAHDTPTRMAVLAASERFITALGVWRKAIRALTKADA